MLRAARKTITGYSEMFRELEFWAQDGVPVAEFLRGSLVPPGWDGPSFATSLHYASQGMGLGFDQHAQTIKALFQDLGNGAGGRKSIQASFYKLLCSFLPSNWNDTLERKVSALSCVEVPSGFFSSGASQNIFPIVKRLGVRKSTAVIKTWANAWTTSSRMHEAAVLPCIFGCNCGKLTRLSIIFAAKHFGLS